MSAQQTPLLRIAHPCPSHCRSPSHPAEFADFLGKLRGKIQASVQASIPSVAALSRAAATTS